MSQYVTSAETKLLGSMPAEDIDALDVLYPGLHDATATAVSGMFDARLIKRYAAPFATPYPDSLKQMVAQWVAYRLFLKRGFNPSSAQDAAIRQDYEDAQAWLKEAADSEKGLVELPTRQASPPGSGAVDSGGPLGYSEASPYTWTDRQYEAVANGDG